MHVIAAKAVAFGEALQHGLQALPGAGARQRARAGQGAAGARPAHRLRRHRLPHVPGRPAREEDHRQGRRGGAVGRAHITVQQERDPQRSGEAVRHLAASASAARRSPRAASPSSRARSSAHLIADVLDAPRRRRGARARAREAWRALTREVSGLRLTPRLADAMKCPFCGSADTQVIDSRVSEPGDSIRRRRRCTALPEALHHLRDGRAAAAAGRQDQRHALRLRRRRRCASASSARCTSARCRPSSSTRPSTASSQQVLALGEREIPSRQVGEMVMQELYKLDKVAYIRFASVYRSFQDVSDFRDALKEVEAPAQARAQVAAARVRRVADDRVLRRRPRAHGARARAGRARPLHDDAESARRLRDRQATAR